MAQIYTRRLVAHYMPIAATQVVFTNTHAGTTVLRDLVVTNLHTTAQVVGLFISVPGGVNPFLIREANLAAGQSHHLELRQELLEGETISAQTTLGAASFLVSAYVFET